MTKEKRDSKNPDSWKDIPRKDRIKKGGTSDYRRRNPDNRRNIRIKISVSEADKQKLQEKASKTGLTLAEYIYFSAMDIPLRVYVPEVSDTLRLIANESNNLNQIAHKANEYMFLTPSEVRELKALIDKINTLIDEESIKIMKGNYNG